MMDETDTFLKKIKKDIENGFPKLEKVLKSLCKIKYGTSIQQK